MCKLTRENETKSGKRWRPELFYIFITAVMHDPKTDEFLFTRSKIARNGYQVPGRTDHSG
ncbi:MAG: hypothetical protein GF365_04605 [Candidatus Buchananbacteria bacterium]|nr:hypothetical protein [Candidatus Buchananbacteria bacterium]